MSARSRTEATQIKKIIRFFKQGMSVKKTNNNIFIVSPNIFTINCKTREEIREYYPEYANTALENIAGSINFSSESVPLQITTNRRRTKYETLFYP